MATLGWWWAAHLAGLLIVFYAPEASHIFREEPASQAWPGRRPTLGHPCSGGGACRAIQWFTVRRISAFSWPAVEPDSRGRAGRSSIGRGRSRFDPTGPRESARCSLYSNTPIRGSFALIRAQGPAFRRWVAFGGDRSRV